MKDKKRGLSFEITWANLFPEWVQKKIEISFKNNDSELWAKTFPKGTRVTIGKWIVRQLLPPHYRTMPKGRDITDIGYATFSKYWTCANDTPRCRYDVTVEQILNEGRTGKYSFETLPFNKQICENVKALFSLISAEDEDLGEYRSYIEKKINEMDRIRSLQVTNCKNLLLKMDFEKRLSCLVAVAATWPSWNSSLSEELKRYLLPNTSTTPLLNSEWLGKREESVKKSAADNLLKAERDFNMKNYDACKQACSEIIKFSPLDDAVAGRTYYLWAMCLKNQMFSDSNEETLKGIVDLFQKAVKYGYTAAFEELKALHTDFLENAGSLLCRPIASTGKDSYLVFNTSPEEPCIQAFLETIPKSMRKGTVAQERIVFAKSAYELMASISFDKNMQYLLLSEDYNKNFQDLIKILEEIRKHGKIGLKQAGNVYLSKITVYLRTDEEKYVSLIDTALKKLDGICVPLYLIDDAKWPVHQLLTYHPLFYPFRSLGLSDLETFDSRSVIFNYTVISARDDRLTNWLVREAFWLGCFAYKNVYVNIQVISPEGDKIDQRLHFDCPGIYTFELPDSEKISKIQVLPSQKVKSLACAEILSSLKDLAFQKNTFDYIVVNAGNDIDGLELAIKIREWSIQKAISSGKRPDRTSQPVIAFYCQDNNTGNLSRQLVVQGLEHGNSWYNNYNLIPFGMYYQKYAWYEIDGVYLERISQCTHLQYCGLDVSASKEKRDEKLADYYTRCYNHDSSMAVALSMPYRLFQASVSNKLAHISPQIMTSGWDILDEDAYKTPSTIAEMAQKFEQSVITLENQNRLQLYEHSRWGRWMLSRGWIGATPKEVLLYQKLGNPKQQLYIARMHGCLCSWDDLRKLAQEMGMEKDAFTNKDLSNIKSTSQIIQSQWFAEKPKERIKEAER